MKSSLLLSLGLLPLFASPIFAADLPVNAKAPLALYNWTGCYDGAQFGSMFAQKDWGAFGSHHETGLTPPGRISIRYLDSRTNRKSICSRR
jgi:opacity protein-like surface antigen